MSLAIQSAHRTIAAESGIQNFIHPVLPFDVAFAFLSSEKFEAKARQAVAGFVNRLGGKGPTLLITS